MYQFAKCQPCDGAEHIYQFGYGDEAQQKEIDVENVRIVGNKIFLIHQIDGIDHQSNGGKPATEPLSQRVLTSPIMEVEIQIRDDDQQDE